MNLDTLLAEREIERNVIGLARAMDARDWPALRALLADTASADFGTGEVSGGDEIVAFIRGFLDNCGTTQHLIGNVQVEVAGDAASSRAYVSDMHLARGGGQGDGEDVFFRTLGDYHDEWVRSGGRWLLSRRVKHNRATLGSMAVFES